MDLKLVSKSGAWFAYNGDKIGQGRENAKTYLKEHPEVMEELEAKIRSHYQIGEDAPLEDKNVKPMLKDGGKKGGKKASGKAKEPEKAEEASEEPEADVNNMSKESDTEDDDLV